MSKDSDNSNWEDPKWFREQPRTFWDPSRKLIKTIRDYQKLAKSSTPFAKILKKQCVLRHRFWSVVTGAEVDLNCEIGGGFLMPHPNGIVIHPKAKIGVNCLIFQQVTLAGEVTLGYHVDVGAGAKLLGPIEVGNNVQVGANAVVNRDVGSDVTVVGIPAKEVKKP